jgi:hypothetical protein
MTHPMGGSADFADRFTTVENLVSDLRALGVVFSIGADGRLSYDAPRGVVTDEILARIRESGDEVLGIVERIEERATILEYDAGLDRREAERRALAEVINDSPEPMPPGVICPWCNGSRLVDALEGLRCWDCGRIAWVRRGRSIIRADCLKVGLDI